MSGKPYPEGVRQLSLYFRDLSEAQDRILRLEGIINQKQGELAAERDKAQDARQNIQRLMQEMDVHAPGNFGYEGRLMALLQELNNQAERYGRMNP